MARTLAAGILIGLLLWSAGTVAEPQTEAERVALLLVDETHTLQASILVQILAQTLNRTDLFQMEAKVVQVRSSFDDPLGPNVSEKQYEMILVIPRGLEDGSLRQLWIATRPITHQTRPELMAAMETVKSLIAQGSGGLLEAVGVMDDALPAWFAAIFLWHGWLK